MAEPHAGLTAGRAAGELPQPDGRSPASSVCYMAATPAHDAHSTPPPARDDGEATPSQSHAPPALDENDSTPRSEAPSLPDAVTASLLS